MKYVVVLLVLLFASVATAGELPQTINHDGKTYTYFGEINTYFAYCRGIEESGVILYQKCIGIAPDLETVVSFFSSLEGDPQSINEVGFFDRLDIRKQLNKTTP